MIIIDSVPYAFHDIHYFPMMRQGSLFVTFCTQEDADKFIGAPMVYYKTNEITKISR